jgi:hypothetical protein
MFNKAYYKLICCFTCCFFLFSCESGSSESSNSYEDLIANESSEDLTVTESYEDLKANEEIILSSNYSEIIISWAPPTNNIDGSELTNLMGYKIYYGISEDKMDNVIILNDSEIDSYTVSNFFYETDYYFYITAINSYGYESEHTDYFILTL